MSSIKSSKTLTFENENLSIKLMNKVVYSYCEQPLLFRWIICFDICDIILSNNTAVYSCNTANADISSYSCH